jgi:hypothetical protein
MSRAPSRSAGGVRSCNLTLSIGRCSGASPTSGGQCRIARPDPKEGAYSIWRLTSRHTACAVCGQAGMIPADAPRAFELKQRAGRHDPTSAARDVFGRKNHETRSSEVKQGKDDNACGPICIRMAMDYYLKKKRQRLSKGDRESILEETMGGDRSREAGARRKDLNEVLRRRGFICKELPGSRKETKLASLRLALDARKLVILGCRAKFKYHRGRDRHYIVLPGMDKSHIYVNDPHPGKPAKIEIESFLRNGQSSDKVSAAEMGSTRLRFRPVEGS